MIAVIDYGTGNLRSVAKAFEFLGHSVLVTSDAAAIGKCRKLVLPGVGAFGDCMRFLQASGFDKLIADWISQGKSYLGICLGMQVLFEESSEHGTNQGLGMIKGKVKRFSSNVKVPQIGWNKVNFKGQVNPEASDGYYYFVHSYYCEPEDDSLIWATTEYGGQYCSAVASNNVLGVQFHPEKSSKLGLDFLNKFAEAS